MLREELTPIFLEPFKKTAKEVRLPNSLYEATTILIPNLDKDTMKKNLKLQTNITDEHKHKNT